MKSLVSVLFSALLNFVAKLKVSDLFLVQPKFCSSQCVLRSREWQVGQSRDYEPLCPGIGVTQQHHPCNGEGWSHPQVGLIIICYWLGEGDRERLATMGFEFWKGSAWCTMGTSITVPFHSIHHTVWLVTWTAKFSFCHWQGVTCNHNKNFTKVPGSCLHVYKIQLIWLKSLISCFSHGFFMFIGSYMYITL